MWIVTRFCGVMRENILSLLSGTERGIILDCICLDPRAEGGILDTIKKNTSGGARE